MDSMPIVEREEIIAKTLKSLRKVEHGDKIAIHNNYRIEIFSGRKNHKLAHESEVDLGLLPKNVTSLENLHNCFREIDTIMRSDEEAKTLLLPYVERALPGLEALLHTYSSSNKEKPKAHFIQDCIDISKQCIRWR